MSIGRMLIGVELIICHFLVIKVKVIKVIKLFA